MRRTAFSIPERRRRLLEDPNAILVLATLPLRNIKLTVSELSADCMSNGKPIDVMSILKKAKSVELEVHGATDDRRYIWWSPTKDVYELVRRQYENMVKE